MHQNVATMSSYKALSFGTPRRNLSSPAGQTPQPKVKKKERKKESSLACETKAEADLPSRKNRGEKSVLTCKLQFL